MKRIEAWIVALATISAAPLALVVPWMAVFRLLVGSFPEAAPLYLLELPPYLWFRFTSSMSCYAGYSIAALLLSLLGVAMVSVRLRRQAWRSARLYLSLLGVVAVVALPFWMRYEPAAEPLPGIEVRQVDPPGLLQGVVKQAQVAVEQSEYQYEPLGWADARTFVYRLWRGGRYEGEEWSPGTVQGVYAYDVHAAVVTPFWGDPEAVAREFCARASCIEPRLSAGPPPYFPGHYATTLLSPDGRWAAFTVRHSYGPEDLLVMEMPEMAAPDAVTITEFRRMSLWPFQRQNVRRSAPRLGF
jgi:hypothetical protein